MLNKRKSASVVIFGRTNVGKSTLFNTLTEKRQALTADAEATTRDANVAMVDWQGSGFELTDTGGIIDIKNLTAAKKQARQIEDIDAIVQARAREYLSRADLILFLVDTRAGLMPDDRAMAMYLKKRDWHKKTLLVANKADNPKLRDQVADFNKLGLGAPLPVSATNSSGTGDLLDEVIERLPAAKLKPGPDKDSELTPIKVSIIGKPNVGKSSLINRLVGENRLIVSDTAHTTREPQDININFRGRLIQLVDTAGIHKQGRKAVNRGRGRGSLTNASIAKSLATLKHADIALLMLDINEEVTKQEAKLIEDIIKQKASLIIVANKWDRIKERDTKHYSQEIYKCLPFATWAPIQFCSALTGEKTGKILELVLEVYAQRQTKISDNALSKFLNRVVKQHKPAKGRGTKHPRIWELKQVESDPPVFMVRIGAKDNLHFSYLRFMENRLREKFGFLGTPVTLYVERNRQVHGQHEARNV